MEWKMIVDHWLFWALLAALFAALMTIFAKMGLEDIDSDVAQLVRTAVVLPLIAVLVMVNGKWHVAGSWSARTWLFLALSGLATGVSWLCYFRALGAGEASRVAAVDKFSLVMVAVLAALLLGERMGAVSWCGIGLITVGLVIVSLAK
jgi:bacterial/archaeal transporter family protein